MKRFEYAQIILTEFTRKSGPLERLCEVGEQGWELRGITANGVGWLIREVEPAPIQTTDDPPARTQPAQIPTTDEPPARTPRIDRRRKTLADLSDLGEAMADKTSPQAPRTLGLPGGAKRITAAMRQNEVSNDGGPSQTRRE